MEPNSKSAGLAGHARKITTTWHRIIRHAWLWIGFLAFATIAFGPRPAEAAVAEVWVQRYSNAASSTIDKAVKIVRDEAGDIIVTGSTAGGFPGADMLTIKYSGADGSVLWLRRYNSPGNGEDRPNALAVDGSGNVVATGVVAALGEYYAYTAKYAAADGALLWEQRDRDADKCALAVDGGGNVVVTWSSVNRSYYYTAKYAAADGALLWKKGSTLGQSTAVAVDGSGNVVLTAYAPGTNSTDHYTAKYSAADGALLWEKRHEGPAQTSGLALDASGNVLVTGTSSFLGDPSMAHFTAKYAAADGALLWEQRYSPGHTSAVAVDDSGNVVVTGACTTPGAMTTTRPSMRG